MSSSCFSFETKPPPFVDPIHRIDVSNSKKDFKMIILRVSGVIVALGGAFFLLAALQILPPGINAISQLDIGGKVMGGILVGIGLFSLSGSLFRYRDGQESISPAATETTSQIAKESPPQQSGNHTVQTRSVSTHVATTPLPYGEVSEIDSYLQSFLDDHSSEEDACYRALSFKFFYHNCDGWDDLYWKWGFSWRCIQICISSLGLYPAANELCSLYSTDGSPNGKREQGEPGHGFQYVIEYGFTLSRLVLYKRNHGTDKTPTKDCDLIIDFSLLKNLMVEHFQIHKTPIMVDNQSYPFTIIGIKVTKNETILWIADPHYLNPKQGLYKIVVDDQGNQINHSQTSASAPRALHFNQSWMLFFPKKNIAKYYTAPETQEGHSVHKLNLDLGVQIFQYLNVSQLGMASRVCKKWYVWGLNDRIWEKYIPSKIGLIPEGSFRSEYKTQKLNQKFIHLCEDYNASTRSMKAGSKEGQTYLDQQWEKIDAFIKSYPEMNLIVPPKIKQSDLFPNFMI